MYGMADLRLETQEALAKVWFVQAVEEIDRARYTLSSRLHIRPALVVQAFVNEQWDLLYFALILDNQRIFGIDREAGGWHVHPYEVPDRHEPLPAGLEPKPLLKFLTRVEKLLLRHGLLYPTSADPEQGHPNTDAS